MVAQEIDESPPIPTSHYPCGHTILYTSRINLCFILRSLVVEAESEGEAFTSTSHGLSSASISRSYPACRV